MPVTVGQLLYASFPRVLDALRGGNPWVAEELNEKARRGLLVLRTLSPVMRSYSGALYRVEEMSVPVVLDVPVYRGDTITAVSDMIEYLITTHDDLLLQRFSGDYGVVASRRYRYEMNPVMILPDGSARYRLLTAIAVIPAWDWCRGQGVP